MADHLMTSLWQAFFVTMSFMGPSRDVSEGFGLNFWAPGVLSEGVFSRPLSLYGKVFGGRFFMQLTRYTDYGLRTLIYLSVLPAGRSASIDEVSEVFGLSRNHVNKIVHQLGKEGLVITQRGKGGGMRIGRDPSEINLGDVVRRLENNLEAVNCDQPDICVLLPGCHLKNVLADAMAAFLRELDQYVLADLVHKPQIVRLLGVGK